MEVTYRLRGFFGGFRGVVEFRVRVVYRVLLVLEVGVIVVDFFFKIVI